MNGKSSDNQLGAAADDGSLLDRATAAVRGDVAPAQEAEAARGRVWHRLMQEAKGPSSDAAGAPGGKTADHGRPIAGCGDVRALLGAYRAGTLSPARQLLVQMHLRDCVGCREA
ncbi:MAG TPA: zf-HC2 domain-containing protein, partial [Polyangia bacterium]